jgi:hypothetical protein
VDHLLYDCTKVQREREKPISNVLKQGNWPASKSDLVNKYIKHFIQFTNSVDFEKLGTHLLVQITVKEHSNINTKCLYVYMMQCKTHKNGVCIMYEQPIPYTEYVIYGEYK